MDEFRLVTTSEEPLSEIFFKIFEKYKTTPMLSTENSQVWPNDPREQIEIEVDDNMHESDGRYHVDGDSMSIEGIRVSKGARGDIVTVLHENLARLGHGISNGKVQGSFVGKSAYKAVVKFQSDYGRGTTVTVDPPIPIMLLTLVERERRSLIKTMSRRG